MALVLIPTKVINDALAHSRSYARKFKSCQSWSKDKRKRMITSRGVWNLLWPGSRIYKGLKFKSGTGDCAVYADKALTKLQKAEEVFQKYKNRRDWGPKQKTEYRNKINAATKYVHAKLGLTGSDSKEAEATVVSGARTRAAVAEGSALPAEVRASVIASIRAKLGTGAPTTITSMSDAELLALDDVADLQEDEAIGGTDLSVDGITDWVSEHPLATVGVIGGAAAGLWLLYRNWS